MCSKKKCGDHRFPSKYNEAQDNDKEWRQLDEKGENAMPYSNNIKFNKRDPILEPYKEVSLLEYNDEVIFFNRHN